MHRVTLAEEAASVPYLLLHDDKTYRLSELG